MFGILNVNKPPGWSSRDVVNRVQRLVRPVKVGHAGTLDPLATGVLIVALGQATRLIQYSHRLPKRYTATFVLGRTSPSDDIESEPELLQDAPIPSQAQIEETLPLFLGQIEQVPPAFAAVKIRGQRAYKLARRGEKVDLQPRPVTIHALRVTSYSYPEIVLEIECGSGTYVRALGRDIAKQLGTAAVMTALERTAIGSMCVSEAVVPDQLVDGLQKFLLPPLALVDTLDQVLLVDEEITRLHNGLSVSLEDSRIQKAASSVDAESNEVVGINHLGRVVTVLRMTAPGIYQPVCNFPQSS